MKLLWFVSTLEDTRFLKAFQTKFEGIIDVFNINFITRCDMLSHKGLHLLPFYNKKNANYEHSDLGKVFNVLSGRLTLNAASKAYQATTYQLEQYISQFGTDFVIVIPSGRHVHHIAATNLAKQQSIKQIYINYSNFPGYTFFDPDGTDCLAAIFDEPAKLNRMYVDETVNTTNVFEYFAAIKSRQKTIPQLASSGFKQKVKLAAFFADTLCQYMTDAYGDRRLQFTQTKRTAVEHQMSYKVLNNEKPYLFFPLQVSTDQQVLVNYDGGSIYAAIDEAINYAKSLGLDLYIREHPAEANKNQVREYLIKQLAINPFLHVTQATVTDLITGCDEVITINSTVGLESRINCKPVKFIGKSFYQKSSDLQLALYLSKYLIPVDYHNPEMSCEIVEEILSRAQ
jgi:capsule polysaccharide modification protein KpsS